GPWRSRRRSGRSRRRSGRSRWRSGRSWRRSRWPRRRARWALRRRPRRRLAGGDALMLSPKRVKHRKHHRGRMRGNARGGVRVQFGDYGLKALERGWITNRQIEAARVATTRKTTRGGEQWIHKYPDNPISQNP